MKAESDAPIAAEKASKFHQPRGCNPQATVMLDNRKENRKINKIALHTDNVVITFALRRNTGASRENLRHERNETGVPILEHLQWEKAIGQEGCVLPMILYNRFIILRGEFIHDEFLKIVPNDHI